MNLSPEQHAAVTTESRKALVLAGAGSGKTRVLVERIAHLVEHCQASPSEILALTFTRKAAGEMRERLAQRLGPQAFRATLGTMHAVALAQIKRFCEYLGLRRGITVYSEWEESTLLKDAARELGLWNGKVWKGIKAGEVKATFAAYYQKGEEPGYLDPCRDLFKHFITRCKENNALTFGGLLVGLRLLLRQLPAAWLGWKYILVDEAQDLDPLQWSLVRELAEHCGASLFVVGDVSQSIYEWRGAAPAYLVDHAGEFDLYRLEDNYRSHPSIVAAANRLIEHNSLRLPLEMKAKREGLPPNGAQVWRNLDSANLAQLLAETQIHTPGYTMGDTAVLARTHVLLQKLSQELDARGVPHVYIGQKAALTNSEPFRRFTAFLKLAVNPHDNFAFMLVREFFGISDEKYADLRATAAAQGQSHLQAWITWHVSDNLLQRLYMRDANGGFRTTKLGFNLADLRDILVIEHRMQEDMEPAVDFALAWAKTAGPNATVQDYLDWLATYDIQDELDGQEADRLTLCTVHAAKGLEWPVVIVAGVNEGLLPSKQALGDPREIEAERRLAYVAWTRARDLLILAVRPEVTTKPAAEKGKPPRTYRNPVSVSRFVAESGLSHPPAEG